MDILQRIEHNATTLWNIIGAGTTENSLVYKILEDARALKMKDTDLLDGIMQNNMTNARQMQAILHELRGAVEEIKEEIEELRPLKREKEESEKSLMELREDMKRFKVKTSADRVITEVFPIIVPNKDYKVKLTKRAPGTPFFNRDTGKVEFTPARTHETPEIQFENKGSPHFPNWQAQLQVDDQLLETQEPHSTKKGARSEIRRLAKEAGIEGWSCIT